MSRAMCFARLTCGGQDGSPVFFSVGELIKFVLQRVLVAFRLVIFASPGAKRLGYHSPVVSPERLFVGYTVQQGSYIAFSIVRYARAGGFFLEALFGLETTGRGRDCWTRGYWGRRRRWGGRDWASYAWRGLGGFVGSWEDRGATEDTAGELGAKAGGADGREAGIRCSERIMTCAISSDGEDICAEVRVHGEVGQGEKVLDEVTLFIWRAVKKCALSFRCRHVCDVWRHKVAEWSV